MAEKKPKQTEPSIDKLTFTRSWTDPSKFPTIETSEEKVRFDLQDLHDQTKNYINDTLIPELEGYGVQEIVRAMADAGVRYIRLNSDKVLETSTDGVIWEATGSSGHLILDADGHELPQRSRLRFANGQVTDENGETVVTAMKGDTGPVGPAGPVGPVGPTGPLGPVIVPSVDVNGVMSFAIQSTPIVPGDVSVRGPQGPQGVQGLQGDQGERGPAGIQGVPGIQGPKGDQGEPGPAGASGKQGDPGPAGADGIQGPRGFNGALGPAGPVGEQGPMGPQGVQGPPGIPGTDGVDGKSFVIQDIYPTLAALKLAHPTGDEFAYQVTAENDEIFIWSELNNAWSSLGNLRGPQGPAGATGAQGPEGPQGPIGATGAQGPEGPQGPAGAAGAAGPRGETGPTGPTGPKGADGAQGVPGPQGAIGPEGPQGPAGASGQDGKSAYQTAAEAGYSGTETAFNTALSQVPEHIGSKSNPHNVTASQVHARPDTWTPTAADVGARPDTWTPTATDVGAIPAPEKGAKNGVATLGSDGKVPETQLPQMGLTPEILVQVATGSEVVCHRGSKRFTAVSKNGEAVFKLPEYGRWTVSATLGGESTGDTVVDVDQVKRYTVKLAYTRIYGVRWDGSAPTTWERTDEAAGFVNPSPAVNNGTGSSPFDNLMPWSGMVKQARAAGMMVAIPKYWLKVQPWGNGGLWVQIADGPVPGFIVSPAHQDRGDGKGERDVVYVARYKIASDWKSKTGVSPKVNVTQPDAWNGIHSLGSNIWMWDWAMNWTIKFLYLVEFADWNSQKTIGKGCGDNSSAKAMGYTDAMQYHTGTSRASRDEYGLGTQYRNIEGLWDNAYDWVGGCYYNSSGLSVVMNPASFTPGNQSGGTLIGPMVSGWSSKFKIGALPWAIVPTETSGSETTYMSDICYFYASYPCLRVGGYYIQSGNRGLFYVDYNGASDASGNISARSMELP